MNSTDSAPPEAVDRVAGGDDHVPPSRVGMNRPAIWEERRVHVLALENREDLAQCNRAVAVVERERDDLLCAAAVVHGLRRAAVRGLRARGRFGGWNRSRGRARAARRRCGDAPDGGAPDGDAPDGAGVLAGPAVAVPGLVASARTCRQPR